MKLKKILSVFLAAAMTASLVTFVSSAEETTERMQSSVSDSEEIIVKNNTFANPKVNIEYVEPADSENSYDMKITWNDVNPNGWYWVRFQARMGNSKGYLVKSNEITIPVYNLSERDYTVKIFLMNSEVFGCDGFYENVNGDEALLWYSKNVYTPPYFLKCTEKLSATSTQNSVTLKWGKVSSSATMNANSIKPEDIVRYSIEQRVDGKWKKIGTTSKTTYKVNNLDKGVKYDFKVIPYGKEIAINYGISEPLIYYQGYCSIPEEVSVTTKLDSIVNLKVVPSKNTAKITWNKNTAAKYYKVFVWKNGKYTQLTQTKSNSVLNYTASKLNANTSYKFRVTAYNASNKAIAFSDVSTKTLANVANLKAAPSKNTVKLTWSRNASAKYYKVFVLKNNKYTELTKTVNNSVLSCNASKLNANTSYKFRVTAYNASNKAIAFSDVSAKTLANIANLKAAPTKNSVKLTWSRNASAKYYKVFVWNNGKYQLLKQLNNSTAPNYTAANLKLNTAYKYRVTAYNSSNKAIAFSDISTRTLANISNLKAAPAKNYAKLTWSKNTSAKYYKVFVWKNNKWTQLTQTKSNSVLTYTASKLAANTSYKFRVTAYNASKKAIAYSNITVKTKK